MDLALSVEAEDFRARFRAWLADNLRSEWRAGEGGGSQDDAMAARRSWGRALYDGGWAAPEWPTRFGGLGLGIEQAVVFAEETARAQAPQPFNSNAISILGPTLMRFGDASQQARYLQPMLAHEQAWCQAFSEPGAGSDLAGLSTRAVTDGDGFRLHGHKIWSSRAQYADHGYLLVRTDPDTSRRDGLSLIIVELDQDGVEVRPIETMAGTSDFCEIFLDGARVPRADVVGEPGAGWEVATYALSRERGPRQVERALSMGADLRGLLGAVAAREEPADAAERARLVDVYVRGRVVEAVVRRILAVLADDEELGILPSVLKLDWSRTHQDVLALRAELTPDDVLLGRETSNALQEQLLFTRGYTLQSGTTEVQRNVVAKALGLPSGRAR